MSGQTPASSTLKDLKLTVNSKPAEIYLSAAAPILSSLNREMAAADKQIKKLDVDGDLRNKLISGAS